MANITADRDYQRAVGQRRPYLVAAATQLFQGAAVSVNSAGYLVNASDTANTKFVGVLSRQVNNSTGAAGALDGLVWASGVIPFIGTGFTQADVGQKVYTVDNQTVAKTTTNSIYVGRIVEVVSATQVRVGILPDAS